MNPWQQAKKWQLENSDLDFEELLGMYMSNGGHVWSSPTEFCMFVKARLKNGDLVDGNPNAWYIQLCAGKNPFNRLREIWPEPMDFVCWHRGKGRLHVWRWEKFDRFNIKEISQWDSQHQY